MNAKIFSATLMTLFAVATVSATTDAALARGYHRQVSAQGSGGRGYQKNVDRNCANGTCNGQRSVQTNQGYGYTANHNRSCANGSCNSNTTVTGNNGNVWTRSSGASKDGNGNASWYSNTSGPNGGSVNRSGSVTTNNPPPPQN